MGKKVVINGEEIEYKDVIITDCVTTFSLWDRIKIILGCKVRTRVEVYTLHDEVLVSGSVSKTSVDKIVSKKGKAMVYPPENNTRKFKINRLLKKL